MTESLQLTKYLRSVATDDVSFHGMMPNKKKDEKKAARHNPAATFAVKIKVVTANETSRASSLNVGQS